MPPPDAERAALRNAAAELQLPLSESQGDALFAYLGLLQRWNRVYNLTSIRDGAQMLSHHVVDSLAAVAALRRRLPGRALSVLDVGSGGGLPGVVMAIMNPEYRVVCVDAVAKKAGFIRQVAAELGLRELRAVHARVESMPPAECDVVASRAFAALGEFVGLTRGHLAPRGQWMAMKGRHPEAELAALPDTLMFHVEPLKVPGLDAERCVVWIEERVGQGGA